MPSKQAFHRDDRSHHPTACKTTSPPLWLRRATEREFSGVSAALLLQLIGGCALCIIPVISSGGGNNPLTVKLPRGGAAV